ncbi:MAG TPA: hypothetical protein VFH73_11985 [Polyangia bacterium]|nr:hypothetical protein [Polyangia bacterium]
MRTLSQVALLGLVLRVGGGCGSGGGSRSLDSAAGGTDAGGGVGGTDGATSERPSPASGGAAGGSGGADDSAAGGTDAGGMGDGPDAAVDTPPGEMPAACSACTSYGPVQKVGTVQTAALTQLSGIAASHRNPGVLFVHNDGARPEFFAVSEAGALLGQFTISGVTARDIEDIAVARCPTGVCVYLADIGNNLTPRPDFAILRTPEPAVMMNGGGAPVAVTGERLVFTYPDGAHNAETLLVDPATGSLYVINKLAAGMPSSVYRLPATFGAASAVATKIADLPVPAGGDEPATGGSAHPCGIGFLLRTYNTLYEFRIPAGTPFEDAFRATPMAVPAAQEQKSEGVTYSLDGRSYFTTSEGNSPPINRVSCR